MRLPTALISLLLFFVSASTSWAEWRLLDELDSEMIAVGRKLYKGQKRDEILCSLQAAIQKNARRPRVQLAKELAQDLADSIKAAAKRQKAGRKLEEAPEEFLDESKLELHLLAYSENRRSLAHFADKNPGDPSILMIKQGREAIERLIPALNNRAPIPAKNSFFVDGEYSTNRVCDLALRLIEHVSLCKFHFNASTGSAFHELKPEVRRQRIARIEEWWKENKNRTIIEGIRAQIPHAESHEKLEMVKNLIRQAENENSKADKEFGLEMMRRWLPSDNDAYTANALAEFGDFSAVDVFYKTLNDSLNVRGRYWQREANAVFYLTKYGKRREWELLLKIAEKEIEQGKDAGQAGVWPALVNCHDVTKTPYTIPGLGLALAQTKQTGSRYINEIVGAQNFSYADKATQSLQELTKFDFGYRVDGSEQERMTAIKKAQQWWADEGKAKYTFEYIEREMVKEKK
jgi:hypothetical protein